MFHHDVQELQYSVSVSGPDPRFVRLLLEQFGPNGAVERLFDELTPEGTLRLAL